MLSPKENKIQIPSNSTQVLNDLTSSRNPLPLQYLYYVGAKACSNFFPTLNVPRRTHTLGITLPS